MVEKVIKPQLNVVDFARYQAGRAGKALAIAPRACRHCGAALLDGENEDDCSSILGIEIKAPRLRKNTRKFRAD
jgi:predicted Zn-ribbon and HTH transcriptional regulator